MIAPVWPWRAGVQSVGTAMSQPPFSVTSALAAPSDDHRYQIVVLPSV